jgi:protein involved in polysaccharide export with SLBB domain
MNRPARFTGVCLSAVQMIGMLAILTGCATPNYSFSDHSPDPGSNAPVVIPPEVLARQTNTPSSESPGVDTLGPGVRVTITFSGLPSSALIPKHEEQIREDGYISPPYLPRPVMAAGKKIGKLQEELQALYVPDYFKVATVTVTSEGRFFYVGGEVKTPNRYIYTGEINLIQAIQSAGGLTDFARRSQILVTRATGEKKTVNYDKALKNPKLNLVLFPGDTIHIGRRVW